MRQQQSMTTTPASKSPGVSRLEEEQPMAELGDALKKLSAITPHLNKSTDGANAAFRATEEILAKLGVGIDTSVMVGSLGEKHIGPTDEERDAAAQRGRKAAVTLVSSDLLLVYERIAGKHRIGFQEHIEESSAGGYATAAEIDRYTEPVPWDQSTREWKLKGVSALAELIESLAKKAEELASSADAATAAVDSILRDLGAEQRAKSK